MSNIIKKRLFTVLKGAGMGAADIVPGVSGGTIALITGIYETLINALKSFDLELIRLLFKGRFTSIWKKINGSFLLSLFIGLLSSIVLISRLMTWLFIQYPTFLWSFFMGLIIASSWVVLRGNKKWISTDFLALIVGIIIAWVITGATPATTPESLPFIFLAGAIAISAMILPGISGSFILVIFGKYLYMLDALNNFKMDIVLVFMAGCVFGLISFSRIISWMFRKYHNMTIALLAGFMLGSLNKVWPWKETIETMIDRHGEVKPLVQANILPIPDINLLISIGLIIIGALLVLLLSRKKST